MNCHRECFCICLQEEGYDLGGLDVERLDGESLIAALTNQEDQRAISRGAAGETWWNRMHFLYLKMTVKNNKKEVVFYLAMGVRGSISNCSVASTKKVVHAHRVKCNVCNGEVSVALCLA